MDAPRAARAGGAEPHGERRPHLAVRLGRERRGSRRRRPASSAASTRSAGSVRTGSRPSSCAASSGHCGSSSARCACRQEVHAVRPGTTTGPTLTRSPASSIGTWVTSPRIRREARRGSSSRCATTMSGMPGCGTPQSHRETPSCASAAASHPAVSDTSSAWASVAGTSTCTANAGGSSRVSTVESRAVNSCACAAVAPKLRASGTSIASGIPSVSASRSRSCQSLTPSMRTPGSVPS